MNFLKKIFQRFNQSPVEKNATTNNTPLSEGMPSNHLDTKLFKRVPEQFPIQHSTDQVFHFAIIDLETLGLDPKIDPIMALGLLKGTFTRNDGITQIIDVYHNHPETSLIESQPTDTLSEMMQKTFNQQAIDWQKVAELLSDCDLVICYNSKLQRNFLENQAPVYIQEKCKDLLFGCLLKDIDWSRHHIEANTLKLLNYELGFYYNNANALSRCWAILNSLVQAKDAFIELKNNVKKRTIIICLLPNLLERKNLLRLKRYTYTDGSKRFPKCWWISIPEEDLDKEIAFLENIVFDRKDVAENLICFVVPSKMKHSSRFHETMLQPQRVDNQWVLRESIDSFS